MVSFTGWLCRMMPGESIGGRSIVFIAYADGFREVVIGRGVSEREQLRAELLDQLMPMSVPFSQYQNWRETLPLEPITGP